MNLEHPRHPLPRPYYLGLGNYFLTICTAGRRTLFTGARLVNVLVTVMLEQFCRNEFSVDAYCFMPDHCHILAGSLSETCDLAQAVRAYKGVSATRARKLGVRNLWQRDYYEHILRSSESVNSVAAYIFANPVRAGLIKNPMDWPFSGSSVFEWKTLPNPIDKFVPSWKNSV
jgi:putative transposase